MSGHKYVAPELAIGLSKLISKRNQNNFCTISVARMAVDDVNSNTSMLANYELSLDIKDGKCEPDVVMKMFIDIIRTNIFGDPFDMCGINFNFVDNPGQ